MKSILIVTYEYPYGTAETFFDTELDYISRSFSQIWICPARAIWSHRWFVNARSQKRPMPSNVDVCLPRVSWSQVVRELCLMSKWAATSPKQTLGWIVPVIMALREGVKASMLISALRMQLRALDDKVPAYSYWKSESAAALAVLKLSEDISQFITRCHGLDLYDERLKYPFRPYEMLVSKQADAIVAVSCDGFHYLMKKGYAPQKTFVHRLGVPTAKKISPPSKDGVLRIISCSSLIAVKQVPLLAEALSHLIIPFEWIHFGDGPDRSQVEATISTFPANGRAVLKGFVNNREIYDYYANNCVDVFVNISCSEGVPVSVMEALAHGVPCIATDVGGTSEIVNDKCGFLLPSVINKNDIINILLSVKPLDRSWLEKRTYALRQWRLLCSAEANYSSFAFFLANLLDCVDNLPN